MSKLDEELFEAIFKTKAPDNPKLVKKAIGLALSSAIKEDDLEDLIEIPSRETFEKWIRQGEEKRKKRCKEI